ncbi:high mobility group family [Striga asiatica]|uniref:High mobility group family n=1 Tax=Striga asiatica TaxID=4170 RepID=A0A5A7PWZ5_STRAF|nr:high mobility group family [Striga asiatica]
MLQSAASHLQSIAGDGCEDAPAKTNHRLCRSAARRRCSHTVRRRRSQLVPLTIKSTIADTVLRHDQHQSVKMETVTAITDRLLYFSLRLLLSGVVDLEGGDVVLEVLAAEGSLSFGDYSALVRRVMNGRWWWLPSSWMVDEAAGNGAIDGGRRRRWWMAMKSRSICSDLVKPCLFGCYSGGMQRRAPASGSNRQLMSRRLCAYCICCAMLGSGDGGCSAFVAEQWSPAGRATSGRRRGRAEAVAGHMWCAQCVYVVRDKKWREISAVFDFCRTTRSASYALRKHYSTLLQHYELVYFFKLLAPTVYHTEHALEFQILIRKL